MATNYFDQFDSPAAGPPGPDGNYFDQFDPGTTKAADGPLSRGWNKSKQNIGITASLATGNAENAAAQVAQADTYARANSGMAEARELGEAWERGDGIAGGIKEVAGEFAKDWRDAPGVIGGLRATGKNLQAMGSGLLEQVPNMVAPVAGMVAGAAGGAAAGSAVPGIGNVAGGLAGGWAGASLGNTAIEGGGMVQAALQKAGIDPQNNEAVQQYLRQNGDKLLGQAGVKGSIIGAVDTLTAGLGGRILNAPARAAVDRALTSMGVDLADKAAVGTAMKTAEFAGHVSRDTAYKAAKTGGANVARNAGVAALDPAGEFAGEFVGQGVATGDWDTKNAALEAFSSLGQSGAMFAGQKAYQAAKRPARGKEAEAGPAAAAEWTTAPGVADPNAVDAQQSAALEAPDFATELGAAPRREGGVDFTRDVDTSGLSLEDPAEVERARAARIDFEAADSTPAWETQAGAAAQRAPGLDMPAAEFDTSGLGLEGERKPSELLGLDPRAGPLSRTAARAVDARAAQEAQFIGSTGRDLAARNLPTSFDSENVIDVQGRLVDDRAIGMTRRLTWPQGDAGRNADVAGRPIDGEWTAFAQESGTLGVPRAEMPQVQSEHRGALVNYLKGKGVTTQAGEVQAQDLKPTQAEFSQGKVQRAGQFSGNDRAILISADGYVVDGHHQWLAKRAAGGPVKVLQLQAPIQDLLPLVSQFPSARLASGAAALTQETETYASQANQAQPSSAEPQASAGPTAAPSAEVPVQTVAAPAVAGADGSAQADQQSPGLGPSDSDNPTNATPNQGGVFDQPAQAAKPAGNGAASAPQFSRSDQTPATNVTAVQLRRAMTQRTVDGLARGWSQRPDIVVVNNMQDTAVPEAVRREDETQRSQGAAGNVEGFWYSGKVYLVADALPSSQDVARVLYHEVLGHHGLRGHFGPALDKVRDQVAKMRPKDIQAKAEEYGLDLSQPAHVRYAAEEVLAEMAQTRPDLALVQRAIAAIRTFLREHVPGFKNLELTDAEIVRNYLLPARGFIERGGLVDDGKQELAYSRSAMKSVDANITRGRASLAKALTERTSVHRAMFRNGLGWVDFVWGAEGVIKPNGKTKGAMGLSHILEARQRKDGMSEQEAISSLSEMVSTIASGREIDRGTYGNTVSVKVEHDGFRVGMVKTAGSNAWVVTAFEVNQVQGRPDIDARLSTQSKSTLPRSGLGAGSVAPGDSVPSLDRATRRDSTERGSPAGAGDGGSLTSRNDAGNIQYSRSQPQAAISSSMGMLTSDQERAYLAVAGFDKVPTLRERTKAFTANMGLRMKQATVDQFAPIAELDQSAYMLARMSKGSDGTLEAALLYGKPVLRDGVPDVDVKEGGFAQVLASLKGEQDRFLMWVAAQRAETLKAQGKENLFDDKDISSLKTLNAGSMADGANRAPLYAKALQDLNSFNDSVLKMAQESGLIDQAAYDLMQGQPYVPFYRLMEEEGGMQGQSFSKGLTNQKAWKKLKGGSQQLNGDLLQNLLLNWGNLYAASARNRAALATMDAAEKMAVAYKVPADTKGAAKVMREGMTEHWAVEDPYLLEAISALNYSASPLMKPLAKAKQVLTWGVTVNPTFKLRNLVRDAVSSISMADLSYNPAANVSKGWKLTAKDSQVYASMLASGGVIKFGTQENTERLRAQVAKLGGVVLDQNGAQKLWGQVKSVYDVYQEFGDRTENVNRTALYERLIAKGHSHADASFMARDLMDFSMSGNHPVVRFLTQSVPFLNARLQGLYKLGRAAEADPRRFGAVAGAVTLASLGLMAAYADDEDWKKREDWDRDAYWWFKIGGTAYRIPKPFEVGAIGTLAERTAELVLSKEMTNKRFAERLSHMVAQTFAFDPVPQAFKPLLDIYSNKDSFTGRTIESQADQRLRPEDRYNERTSEAARLLGSWGLPDPAQLLKGEWVGLSPKQVDHLFRGYFSWAASAVTTATDYAIRPALDRGDRPAMRLKEVFLAGNFVESLPSGSSRYVSAMYEQSRDVEQAYASYRDALARGDKDGAADILASDGDKIRSRGAVSTATKLLSQLNQQAKKIEASTAMDASEKRERLQRIEQRRHELARRVMGAGAT